MFWYVFSCFSDGSRYSLIGGENESEDENPMIGFRGCGRLPSSPWNWRWGNALVPLLSWPHVVVCCVWNWGVLSVEAESFEPESRWLQGFFCFKFGMVHAALDLCQKKGQISTRPFWFLGLGHTHTEYRMLKDTQIGENWETKRSGID